MRYEYKEFPYETPPALRGAPEPRRPVAIVGAGPVGLALAIDLALRGVPSVVLDDNNVVSVGSRAICWSKRTLEIFDRLGVGERMVEKGVTWKVGRTYHGEREVWSFDLLPEEGHKMPAFINLQQYYVEEYLVDRCRDFPELIELRFKNRVVALEQGEDGVALTVETPDGTYRLEADWVVACDGARSPLRAMLGLEFEGVLFEERFLIADIEMKADFPAERRFWFEPTFHSGQSALMHKQPDDIWRIDLQLGWDADPEQENRPERIIPRIRKVVGDRPFELDWSSIYTFQCRRLERFVHGRAIFAGDSAHIVSPFGARGGNGGVQDVDNLGWKLAAAIQGRAGPGLLPSYSDERVQAADENILNSSRSTNFMTPKTPVERLFRDQVLRLASEAPFARRMVNSGRLSTPCVHDGSALNGPDDPALPAVSRPGAPAPDAPAPWGWLLDRLGRGFALLALGEAAPPPAPEGVETLRIPQPSDEMRARWLGEAPGAICLIRPDQHVAARWTACDGAQLARALDRAMGRAPRQEDEA
ncbi:FAD-dependent oxidoreductase [Oceanicella actignis]|uniref:3-(3-hydroxy-phenyl)propionate hydroxylase n=1 Tax=Oceanicella actignis TaxID=1189325 RepID=A0A1M7SCB8_9RHOB|nr:FAD-dependent oxidoreductase [Oceanicella actignis]SET26318.1 3-(3-hydroxy-phenyl)propionate hydroxylase [Oceanicella actignis]SHN56135.1 3-(3-hydroxy-phenyl)propionate hydroxylase [Oceanicella actignis]